MNSDLPEWLDGGKSRQVGGGHGDDPHGRRLPGWFWPRVCGAALVGLAMAGIVLWPRPHAPASNRAPSQGTGAQPPPTPYSAQNPTPAWPGPLPYPVVISDQGSRSLIEVTPQAGSSGA